MITDKFVYERKGKFLFFNIKDGKWYAVKTAEEATQFYTYEAAFKKKLDLVLANIKHVKIKKINEES